MGDEIITIESTNRPAEGFTIDVYNFALIPWTFIVAMQLLSQERSSRRQTLKLSIVWLLLAVQMLTMFSEKRISLPYIEQFKVKKVKSQLPSQNFRDYLYIC